MVTLQFSNQGLCGDAKVSCKFVQESGWCAGVRPGCPGVSQELSRREYPAVDQIFGRAGSVNKTVVSKFLLGSMSWHSILFYIKFEKGYLRSSKIKSFTVYIIHDLDIFGLFCVTCICAILGKNYEIPQSVLR